MTEPEKRHLLHIARVDSHADKVFLVTDSWRCRICNRKTRQEVVDGRHHEEACEGDLRRRQRVNAARSPQSTMSGRGSDMLTDTMPRPCAMVAARSQLFATPATLDVTHVPRRQHNLMVGILTRQPAPGAHAASKVRFSGSDLTSGLYVSGSRSGATAKIRAKARPRTSPWRDG